MSEFQYFLGLFANDPDVMALEPGQELFRRGDAGGQMYVVKSGEVQVVDGNHVFATVGEGGIVGEMALIANDPRSATVRAVGNAEVVPVDQRRFLFLVQQAPYFAIRVMSVMAERLRAMNARVTSGASE